MKKRARILSGLAALAALFLAPISEASITRSSTPAREAPALSLTLAAPEPSEFSLFDGTEIARALASRPAFDLISITTDDSSTAVRTRFVSPSELSADELPEVPELLPITSVREQRFNLRIPPDVFGLEPLRGLPGDEASYPKTRYRVFGLLGTPILGELHGVSLELHWRSASFSCGFASGTVGWLSQDPLGDIDSPNLYGFVGMRPHEKTDPLGLCPACGLTFDFGTGGPFSRNALKQANAAADAVGNPAARASGSLWGTAKFAAKTAVNTLFGVLGSAFSSPTEQMMRSAQMSVELAPVLYDPVGAASLYFDAVAAETQRRIDAGDHFGAGEVFTERLTAPIATALLSTADAARALPSMARSAATVGPRVTTALEEAGLRTPSTRWQAGRSIVRKTTEGNPPAFSTVQRRFWKNQGMTSTPRRTNPVTGSQESMELSHRFIPQRLTLVPPNIRNAPFNLEMFWPEEHAAVDWYRWQTLDPELKPLVPQPKKPLF